MLGSEVFERFLQEAAVCAMARATLEKMFAPDVVDELFRVHSQQYERELLFSSVVDVMSLVVCRV